jgi:hypothetical protein
MKTNLYQLKLTKKGYGLFPYIIVKFQEFFLQVPIHFLKNSEDLLNENYPGVTIPNVPEHLFDYDIDKQVVLMHDKLLEVVRDYADTLTGRNNVVFPIWLVENKNTAYFLQDGNFTKENKIPTGGNLVTNDYTFIAINSDHFISNSPKSSGFNQNKSLKKNENFPKGITFYEPLDLSTINAIKIESDFNTVRVLEHEKEDKNIIIRIKNKIGNTLIDFTGANDYRMYCYMHYGFLDSRHYALNNNSNFIISTPQKFILLVRN